jgi:hypothetical protein
LLGVIKHTYNSSTQEARVTGSRFRSQPGLHSEILPRKKIKKEI